MDLKRLSEFRRMIWLFMLVLSLRTTCGNDENTTSLEVPEEVSGGGEGDSEQELSNQLQDVETRTDKWSAWSEWSSCSRSCDGGVSHQLRRCQNTPCVGQRVRYKICNMQPCPEARDFREDQCGAFNSVPYEGTLLHWTAHYDDHNPCALTCKGKPLDGSQALEDDAVMVVARLAEKVQDGTRCRPGSLDMCIDGNCEIIGCDLRIGSNRLVDACGVCGGDGSSCSRPLYHWNLKVMSLCSVTCGGGYKMSRPVCQNRMTGTDVEEELCNASQKPDTIVMECNTHSCPPKWHTTDWGPCSASCGGGSRLRQVFCVEEANNTKIKVNEMKCNSHKPRFQEPCNQMDCPKWQTSPWSGCSISCGKGVQVRIVECRDAQDRPSDLCPSETKPSDSKHCLTGIPCPQSPESVEELLPGLYHTQPLVQPYPPPPPAHAERLVGEQIVPSESTFIPDEWGPCSVSCGEGIRKREVHCKIFLEFSRTIAKLPDKQCSGPKPVEMERCYMEPCSAERLDIKDDPFRSDVAIKVGGIIPGVTYSWKEQGYSECTASCLGGVQELKVICIREDTQKITAPYMCPREKKPEILVRTCNDFACPPKWNYSDFQPCSQPCGIGIQTREVNCIRDGPMGPGGAFVVPNSLCPEPQPPDRQHCNILDCPVKWRTTEWSKCSKTCGGGEKTRTVECKQVMAQNHTVDRPAAMCGLPRPPERKPCNTKSCVLETDKPQIEVSNSTFIQHDVKKKKLTLKVGGAATVFFGTMVKIKCPVKRFNRTRIQWAKDHTYLPKNKKYKISKKGALRILNLTLRDSGVYTCLAGKSSADLVLSVKAKPGEFITSEEIQKQAIYKNEHRADFEIADVQAGREDLNPVFGNDDHSHEQRPDMPRKNPTPKTKILRKPTYPPYRGESNVNFNSLNVLPSQTTLVSDRALDRVESSHSPASSESLKPSVYGGTSAGSRLMPYFQQLISNLQELWPFQTFSNSRGHRMVAFSEHPEDAVTDAQTEEGVTSEDDDKSAVVLGKGTAENLVFEWLLTDWSKCSQTCGGNGFQMRAAHCIVKLHNTSQDVDSILCEDAGLLTPSTIRKCGFIDCPQWMGFDWTPCEESKCFTLHTAIQRREVLCLSSQNITVDSSMCDQGDRPAHKQECENEKCTGKWKVGPWSKCAAACDMQGVKYRILQCVWYGTKRPAGNACRDEPRPPVMKTCKGVSCGAKGFVCKDHSKFCPNVKAMKLCTIMRYKQQCCQTCNKKD